MRRFLSRYWESLLGITPMLLIFAGISLANWNYDYVRTSIDKTVAGLKPATIYLLNRRHSPCVGEVIWYKSKKVVGYGYYRTVAAQTGAVFDISEAGYLLNGKLNEMEKTWVNKATSEAKNQNGAISIPEGHLLIINTEFDPKSERRNWGYEVLPSSQIYATVTHVLFSRDLSRIGTRVSRNADECAEI